GSGGIFMNSTNGTIGIGNLSPDPILLGTTGPNILTIGNNSSTTRIFERFGATGGFISQQSQETVLTGSATLTIFDLLKVIFTINSVGVSILSIDTATNLIAGIPDLITDDAINFVIINIGIGIATIASLSGETLIG